MPTTTDSSFVGDRFRHFVKYPLTWKKRCAIKGYVKEGAIIDTKIILCTGKFAFLRVGILEEKLVPL